MDALGPGAKERFDEWLVGRRAGSGGRRFSRRGKLRARIIGDIEASDMPDDGSNVGHIEPQDAYDALVEALEEGARETAGDSNDNGTASRPHGRA
jgi:hypothetical protein